MSEAAKKVTRSFLDKFQGRTNKVGKRGMQGVLFSSDNKSSKTEKAEIDEIRQVDLDKLIPSNPQKSYNTDNIHKREGLKRPPLKTQTKYDYVPSPYAPEHSSIKSETTSNLVTRTNSQSSTGGNRGKYVFGKYLRLDKDALSHIEFLQSLEKTSFLKRSQRSGISQFY